MAEDKIFLKELEVHCIIGVNEWERMVKQPVKIDYEIPCNARKAARTDDIGDAIDYKSISKWIISFVENSEYNLLETLAEETALGCLSNFDIKEIKLTVRKPGAVRHSKTVGITIERSTDDV